MYSNLEGCTTEPPIVGPEVATTVDPIYGSTGGNWAIKKTYNCPFGNFTNTSYSSVESQCMGLSGWSVKSIPPCISGIPSRLGFYESYFLLKENAHWWLQVIAPVRINAVCRFDHVCRKNNFNSPIYLDAYKGLRLPVVQRI